MLARWHSNGFAQMRWLLTGMLVGAVGVGLAWFIQARSHSQTRIVDAVSVADFDAAGPIPPLLFASHAFYLVKLDTGEPRALYAYAPFVQVMEQRGCPVMWYETFPPTEWVQVFRDGCIGNTFSRDGTRLMGPSTRNLDQFRVLIRDGRILVDTRRLLCDGPGPCKRLH